MFERRIRSVGSAVAVVLLWMTVCGGARAETAAVTVKTVPQTVYTTVRQVQVDGTERPGSQSIRDNPTWMFHLVFESNEPAELRIDSANMEFTRDGKPLWQEMHSSGYLDNMEWIRGAYRLTTNYFLDRVMFGTEELVNPVIPPGGTAEAGVDTIEHPPDLSPEIIDAMDASETSFVPTLTAFYNLLEYGYPAGGFY